VGRRAGLDHKPLNLIEKCLRATKNDSQGRRLKSPVLMILSEGENLKMLSQGCTVDVGGLQTPRCRYLRQC
jgi:hypothetical protein